MTLLYITARIIICSLFLSLFSLASATNELTPGNARTGALGNASVMLSDPFSTYYNQAGLGFVEDYAVGVTAERKFLLNDLNSITGIATIPTGTGTFGLSFNYFGSSAYNEKKAGIAFGKSFGKFSAGLQFDYLGIHVQEYGTKNTFTFEAGIQYRLFENLQLGTHVFNPIRITLEDFADEKIPTIMRFGLSYQPIEQLDILAETEKDIERPFNFRLGVEYDIIEELDLRGGLSTNPLQGSFGFGVNLSSINIDLAADYHPVLGFTPQVSMLYTIPRQKDKPTKDE